jgi:hypothetical protein
VGPLGGVYPIDFDLPSRTWRGRHSFLIHGGDYAIHDSAKLRMKQVRLRCFQAQEQAR